jgi:putative acid phosphatase of HAD superfamily subfamily IIIB
MGTRRPTLWPIVPALLLFATSCAGTGPLTAPSGAPGLVEAKHQVSVYVDSGRYEADIAAVTEQARAYLESRVQRGGKLAIVVDVDETALSNLPSLRANDYGFIVPGPCDLPRGPCGLGAWIRMAQADSIKLDPRPPRPTAWSRRVLSDRTPRTFAHRHGRQSAEGRI